MKIRRRLAHLLLLLFVLSAMPAAPGSQAAGQDRAEAETANKGLRFRLSEGTPPAETPTPAPTPPAPAAHLSDDETNKLLARMPPLQPEVTDTQVFKLRDRSLPPPAIGKIIAAAFAAPGPADVPPRIVANPTTPLEVLRVSPEGDVELAPALSITFSLPMIAISSQTEAAAVVPVTLTPQPKGQWRWLGAQTLIFQPATEGGRLPMATNYTVTIPAGTRSALGNVLPETKTFTFATPSPRIVKHYPIGQNQRRDVLMFMAFDQQVDAGHVLESIKLEPNPNGLKLRLATPDEIAGNDDVKDLVQESAEGRWLAVRAVDSNGSTKDALPTDTNIQVTVPAGFTSAEGPRATVAEQSFTFKTFGAFRAIDTRCQYHAQCSPFDQLQVWLNNQIDAENFEPSQVTITPAIPEVKITVQGNAINIDGVKRSNTQYTVSLDRSIKDQFGQSLSGVSRFNFHVTTALPRLFAPNVGFVVLDPTVKRTFNVYTINYRQIRVKLSRVTADDWPSYRVYQLGRQGLGKKIAPNPPGTVVYDRTIDLTDNLDELSETAIDLLPALTGGFGQVFVQVEAIEFQNTPLKIYAYRPNGAVEAWVEATDIGLDAFADNGKLVVWANSLLDGKALAGVQVNVWPDRKTGTTDADGLVQLPLATPLKSKDGGGTALVVARRGGDVAILPRTLQLNSRNEEIGWREPSPKTSFSWYVINDRRMYRPGEEVHIKGWIRQIDLSPHGDTEVPATAGESVTYVVKDAEDNQIATGTAPLNALAGFDFKIELPPVMNLGEVAVGFKLAKKGAEFNHNFEVQEFRRPEFEVKAEVSEGTHFIGANATAIVTAGYYTGGGLANAEVKWNVTAWPTNFTPPNRGDFLFGKFWAWWLTDSAYGEPTEQEFTGRTDAEGNHRLRLDFDGVSPARPCWVRADASVADVNRQNLSTSTSFLVHPADLYVGLRSSRTFVQPGQAFDISAIVTDLDGNAVPNREIRLRLVRMERVQEKGEWIEKEVDPQEQTITSTADAVPLHFAPTVSGTFQLTAQVHDERGRLNETDLSLWVAGGNLHPVRELKQEDVALIPDRKTYAGGDVAEVLVQAPFAPAEGVMTVRRSGLLRTERFTMSGNSYTLRIPIDEGMTPDVHVQVDLVGTQTRTDDDGKPRPDLARRTAYASGEIKLDIPTLDRRLKVTVTPRDPVVEPGAETTVDVQVNDATGRGVSNADTVVFVVDDAVLTLAGYGIDYPYHLFYPEREPEVNDFHLRDKLVLATDDEVARLARISDQVVANQREIEELPVNGRRWAEFVALEQKQYASDLNTSDQQMSTIVGGSGVVPRSNFNPLAKFVASLPTDAQGHALVKIRLPDNLTRYRVIAVSVAGGKYSGAGESVLTARKQLMARPSAPRFLNFGDRAELPVVVQNQTGAAMEVDVAVRASNAEFTDGAGRSVTIPPNDRVEIRFPIAASLAGLARFQVIAESGKLSDAAEISLPVYTPATTEAQATYGAIDHGSIAQPVQAPADAIRSYGGLEVTTASTQLQELTDAVIYLVNYPYECSEQISSRLLALAALKDVLTAFKAKDLPSAEAMKASVDRDLKRLQGLQNEDGGFDFWRSGAPSVPFVSVHVAHALVVARGKGFAVPQDMLDRAKTYLGQIDGKIPRDYRPESRRAIQAYALYVRNLMKDPDPKAARQLIADAGGVDQLSLESLGWILPVLRDDPASATDVEALRHHLNNRVTETASAAHFADAYSDGAYTILYSDRRTDGVLLDALIGDQPQSELIPKLVRGLLDGRISGHWQNTQENVFILLALDRYFQTYEKTEPDLTARVWLGQDFAGQQTFKGRSADKQQLDLPMAALADRTANGPANLTIDKQGKGRLYYRIGTRYAPASLKLAAADYGFKVERTYEAVDNPADVRRDADGTWHFRAGARVRVRLKMSNPAARYHVALVDPLPAGLEALNPELAGTESLPDTVGDDADDRGGTDWYWRKIWWDHENMRDDRVEAFTSLLWGGEHIYSYLARATTPGLFIVPPAKAEEMYAPETFGRGASDKVRVE